MKTRNSDFFFMLLVPSYHHIQKVRLFVLWYRTKTKTQSSEMVSENVREFRVFVLADFLGHFSVPKWPVFKLFLPPEIVLIQDARGLGRI